MRPLRLLGILAAVLLALGGAALFVAHRYVQSEAFKQAVLRAAHDALGSDVRIRELRVSLFSGVALDGLQVANPGDFPGHLLTADALVVRYRLLPLLRRRLEIREVRLSRPVARLSRRDTGEWSYQGLGAPPPADRAGARAPGSPRVPAPAVPDPSALEIVLPALTVDRGEVTLLGERDRILARAENLALTTSLVWGRTLDGRGTARVETLNAGNRLFVRALAAPLAFSEREVRLVPVTASLAQGSLTGDLALQLAPTFRFLANLQVADADVRTLLREAGNRTPVITGKLRGRARFAGAGGLPSLTGSGEAEVAEGALIDVPVLGSLATLLQVPGLRNLAFDECRLEFTLADGILQTPVVRVLSRDVQIVGQGAVTLAAATLDHRFTLAVSPDLFRRVPREARAVFGERADGFRTVDFRVWGPTRAPRTDLSERLLKGMAEGFLKRGLQKLFR